MEKFLGITSLIVGLAFLGIGIALVIPWVVFCFHSVIIGTLMFLFLRPILFAPLRVFVALGLELFDYGLTKMDKNSRYNTSIVERFVGRAYRGFDWRY
ncbi:hypothetical protein [Thalassotalea fusca]